MTTRQEQNKILKEHIDALNENSVACKKLAGSLIVFGKDLSTLASETGAWRSEDNKNHSNEAEQRKKAIRLLEEIKELLNRG